MIIRWTKTYHSTCGRWRACQGFRSGEWTLYDGQTRDEDHASKRTNHRTLRDAKEYAQHIQDKNAARGRPLIDVLADQENSD